MIHKYFDFTQQGGMPLNQQRLEWMQQSYAEVSGVIAGLIGNNVIVSGCNEVDGVISDGWVVVDNELLPFIGGLKQNKIRVSASLTSLEFMDASLKPVQISRYCEFGADVLDCNWDDLLRIDTMRQQKKQFDALGLIMAEQAGSIQKLNDRIYFGSIPYKDFGVEYPQIMVSMPAPIEIGDPLNYFGTMNFPIFDELISTFYRPSATEIRFYITRAKMSGTTVSGEADFMLIKKQIN